MHSSFHIANRALSIFLWTFLSCLSCRDKAANHLGNAASPYLREQAGNPVDWHEWGEEALQLAKKEGKPLLVSIGYSACHWCHRMEQESFMDTGVARIMNDNFVCIKVDREERPDIDNVYSNACQLIAGSSGWPLNAFALPDGKPFFAGTYYSKQGWTNLLKQITIAYKTQKGKVDLQAQTLAAGIAGLEFSVLSDSTDNFAGKAAYRQIFANLFEELDHLSGGLKGTPKFPVPACIEFLLQYYSQTRDKRAIDAAVTTLTKMAMGGIYDQLDGGFSRYSTDSLWHIPHFEKMLYDNAQLISVYAHAYQLTGNPLFKTILQEVAGFVQRDLRNPEGGYLSSLNADTRDGEGEFYSWKAENWKAILPKDYEVVGNYYNISEEGNWKDGRNVLFATQTPAQFARSNRLQPDSFSILLDAARRALLSERNKRERPTADDKVLTSWNALMMTGYLDAYAALGDRNYLEDALDIARFIEKNMVRENGRLWRHFRSGKGFVDAFLDDYALLARAYLRLYSLTFDKQWLDRSQQLAGYAIADFYDARSGMFFYTAIHSDTAVIRRIELTDGNLPSSNAVMADVLYSLGTYFDNSGYLDLSTRMVAKLSGQLVKGGGRYYASWCLLSGRQSHGADEVAILGKNALWENLELQKNYLPLSLFMGSAGEEYLPLLRGRTQEGHTLIYICTNNTCQRPVERTADALTRLGK